jgi:hypothetical protein
MFGKRCWKCPEHNNGIRNPGTRRQLRVMIARTSEESDRKAFGLESVKRATGKWGTGPCGWFRPLWNWKSRTGLCGVVNPLRNGEKYTSGVSARRTGHVGALATTGVMANRWKVYKIRKLLDDVDTSGFTGTLEVIPSGRAVGALGEWTPQEKERITCTWKHGPRKGR